MSDFNDAVSAQLHDTHAGVRLQTRWLGNSKALDKDQKHEAENCFGASDGALSISKKLFDNKHESFKRVNKVRREAKEYFEQSSLPFPERGVRLLKRDRLDEFQTKMVGFTAALDQAVAALQADYYELRGQAESRLGDLYNPADYPDSLEGEFEISWEPVSFDPPDYLKETYPRIYEQQQRRIAERFNLALELAEQAFQQEFSELLDKLVTKLQGLQDGESKRFHETTVSNLEDFFGRFKDLSVGSSDELDALIDRAQRIVRGVNQVGGADQIRGDSGVRSLVHDKMAQIQTDLDQLMERKPKRMISFDD